MNATISRVEQFETTIWYHVLVQATKRVSYVVTVSHQSNGLVQQIGAEYRGPSVRKTVRAGSVPRQVSDTAVSAVHAHVAAVMSAMETMGAKS